MPAGEAAASKAAPSEQGAEEEAQAPDQALPSTPSKASGLMKYRAPTAPLQRSKLESFDRKIGRATNSLKVSYSGILCAHLLRPSVSSKTSGVPVAFMHRLSYGVSGHRSWAELAFCWGS